MLYLNNAASSYPKPPAVAVAMAAAANSPPVSGARGNAPDAVADPVGDCRALLGTLFGAPADRIFFTSGATESFNLILRGLHLRRVAVTAVDHNASLRPLYALLPDDAIAVVPCDRDGALDLAAMEAALQTGVDALFLNHCSNVTGAVQPLDAVGALARRYGALLVVDAAQSAGVVPIDVTASGVDILVFTGHKGLFGPAGTGGFYLRAGVPLAPAKFGGTGTEGDSVRPAAPALFEVGTQNLPGLAGLAAGLRFVLAQGVDALGMRVDALAARLAEGLRALPNVTVYGGKHAPRGGAVSFTVDGLLPADIGYILRHGYDIEVRTGHQCAPLFSVAHGIAHGVVRASVSALTPPADVETLIEAVTQIAKGAAHR